MRVSGKTFVVTGAGNGIGREVTLQLLAGGAAVAGVDLNEAGLAKTAELAAAGERFSSHPVNITDRDAVEALPDAVALAHGPADAVINIAGVIQKFVKVDDLPFSEIEKVMNVNFWGTVNMVKAFLPVLKSRPQAALVNVASMGAYAPVPGQAVYGASKAAVKVLTEALYAELLDTSVAVTVIFPGAIGTDIAANSGVALSDGSADAPAYKTTAPTAAAAVIVDAVEKGKYRATIGGDAAAMDKLSRLSPKRATTLIAKQMGALLN
ncbi:SDR family NAD(P)-dependent oxidoreductase [Microbacterium hominis]|uniref:SDR family NAD(P)-dependent oxidoreductase n=1 Tax=Microbacterium hominis TaxID=162426 RepID=A0A7D4TPF5_9MICO|nr:SDR family NAD(P)-dependent oxidoreductase [Microbacterium hominis]QKJ18164.1 SDR family NAD(P)-dependent oxidoreductase [Microbacterium hominis]